MVDRELVFEALSALCNARVGQRRQAAGQEPLLITSLASTVLQGHDSSQLQRVDTAGGACRPGAKAAAERYFYIDDEFFEPDFDHIYGQIKKPATYWRGGEKYDRPSGWMRIGLKVLDKYDENTWLGTGTQRTQSCPGEWPVSYHGTSEGGAMGIIKGHYMPGTRNAYGRGIYSSPDIGVAESYAKRFVNEKTKKTFAVVLQNRINPKYREKCNRDNYWLVPIPKASAEQEEMLSKRAIRPYGILIKEL